MPDMGRFADFYRKHLGGTESAAQLYAGFGVFTAGVVLCAVGVIVFLFGDLIFDLPSEGFINQERIKLPAFLGLLGLPLLFFGIQLTLPARKVIHLLSGVGALVCLWGALWFNQAYPGEEWLRGDAVDVISLYTLGLVVLVVTTGVGLVVNFVSRFVVLPGQEVLDPWDEFGREPSIDEIMADIEREVSRQNLSWGGMEGPSGIQNVVRMKMDFGEGAVVSSGKAGLVTELPADEEAESGYMELLRMRGRDTKESSSDDESETDLAINTLKALRQARQEELERSWWYRFKRWFFSLFLGDRRRGKGPEGKDRSRNKDRTGNARKTSTRPSTGEGRTEHAQAGEGRTPRSDG